VVNIEGGEYKKLIKEIKNNNIGNVKSILENANNSKIKINLNEKDEDGWYPLLWACEKDNIDIIKLLIDYASKNNIVLELNEKHKNGYYPLFWACNDNIEIVNLLDDYAKANKIKLEYIPLDFFKNRESEFKKEIDKVVQKINQGSKLKNEIAVLEKFCEDEVEIFREKVNEIFKKWVSEVQIIHESKIKDIISAEDEEVKTLQEKLDQLLNSLPNVQEKVRKNYEHQRKEFEEKIKKCKEESTITLQIPEMVSKEQVDGVLANLLEELNEIKEKVKKDSNKVDKHIESALKQIQFIYTVNIKVLISSMKNEFHIDLEDIASQYNEKEIQIREDYEAEKTVLTKMIDEVISNNEE